jgi:hypothetical protein
MCVFKMYEMWHVHRDKLLRRSKFPLHNVLAAELPPCTTAAALARALAPHPSSSNIAYGCNVSSSSRSPASQSSRGTGLVQKVGCFPSDNFDRLSSHFCVQSEVHYFWHVSARILVYNLFYGHVEHFGGSSQSSLSHSYIFCFVPLPVRRGVARHCKNVWESAVLIKCVCTHVFLLCH